MEKSFESLSVIEVITDLVIKRVEQKERLSAGLFPYLHFHTGIIHPTEMLLVDEIAAMTAGNICGVGQEIDPYSRKKFYPEEVVQMITICITDYLKKMRTINSGTVPFLKLLPSQQARMINDITDFVISSLRWSFFRFIFATESGKTIRGNARADGIDSLLAKVLNGGATFNSEAEPFTPETLFETITETMLNMQGVGGLQLILSSSAAITLGLNHTGVFMQNTWQTGVNIGTDKIVSLNGVADIFVVPELDNLKHFEEGATGGTNTKLTTFLGSGVKAIVKAKYDGHIAITQFDDFTTFRVTQGERDHVHIDSAGMFDAQYLDAKNFSIICNAS